MHSEVIKGEPQTHLVTVTKPATAQDCLAVIETLALEVGQLRERMAWLQERLKVDSNNSSTPPSSDGLGGGNRAQGRASQRKRGGRKGHPGTCRALLRGAEVDGVYDQRPARAVMWRIAGLCMGLHTILGKKRGRVRLVAGVSPEFRACVPLFTPCKLNVHDTRIGNIASVTRVGH